VPDKEFLIWLDTIIKNVPETVHFYILRNKPLLKETVDIVKKYKNITMKIVPNKDYVNPNVEKGIKFVKLRYDSIMLAKPKQDDWIMLGDDDMFFLDNFKDCLNEHYKLFEKIEYGIATHRVVSSYTFDSCKFEGLRHGIFFKYNKVIIKQFGKLRNLYGGGEDSLLHQLFYIGGITKSLRFVFNGIEHVGGNMNRYFDSGMKLIHDERYTVCAVHKLAEAQKNEFIREQNSKCLEFFNSIYKDLQKIEYRTEEEEAQLKEYGYTFHYEDIVGIVANFIPAQNWLMPPLFEKFFENGKRRIIEYSQDTIPNKESVMTITGIFNVADTLRFKINGEIPCFNDREVGENAYIYYTVEDDGIYINVQNKQSFIQEYGNCCVSIKTSITKGVEYGTVA
jgi:hypothetical protein